MQVLKYLVMALVVLSGLNASAEQTAGTTDPLGGVGGRFSFPCDIQEFEDINDFGMLDETLRMRISYGRDEITVKDFEQYKKTVDYAWDNEALVFLNSPYFFCKTLIPLTRLKAGNIKVEKISYSHSVTQTSVLEARSLCGKALSLSPYGSEDRVFFEQVAEYLDSTVWKEVDGIVLDEITLRAVLLVLPANDPARGPFAEELRKVQKGTAMQRQINAILVRDKVSGAVIGPTCYNCRADEIDSLISKFRGFLGNLPADRLVEINLAKPAREIFSLDYIKHLYDPGKVEMFADDSSLSVEIRSSGKRVATVFLKDDDRYKTPENIRLIWFSVIEETLEKNLKEARDKKVMVSIQEMPSVAAQLTITLTDIPTGKN